MKRLENYRRREDGFTIIELMIATTVLSVILVMVTFMMISIGKLYYKGISQAKAQQTARNIVEDVSNHLELNDSPPTESATADNITFTDASGGSHTIAAYCIGEVRYSYILGRQIGGDAATQISHVLWRDRTPAAGCVPADLRSNDPSGGDASNPGTELMTDRGRLAALTIDTSNSPYEIEILVALGENDLFDGSGINTLCRNQTGSEFCATSQLRTSVTKRLPG